jgi:hypothetical protein
MKERRLYRPSTEILNGIVDKLATVELPLIRLKERAEKTGDAQYRMRVFFDALPTARRLWVWRCALAELLSEARVRTWCEDVAADRRLADSEQEHLSRLAYVAALHLTRQSLEKGPARKARLAVLADARMLEGATERGIPFHSFDAIAAYVRTAQTTSEFLLLHRKPTSTRVQ